MSECTAFSGNAHQLQLLLGVATTQVQLHPAQKQAVLIVQLVSRYGAGEWHRGKVGTPLLSLMAILLSPTAASQMHKVCHNCDCRKGAHGIVYMWCDRVANTCWV